MKFNSRRYTLIRLLHNPFADYNGRYTRIPDETNGPPYFFNTVVLDSTEQPVSLLFDYAVYTIGEENAVDTTTPPVCQPSPSPNVADRSKPSSTVILGSTLGVVFSFAPDY
ncbi:hypothetical protein PTI98_007934 [Pleurotus ostreatus]|nr:hypothetical protein PTI98_007934 [Pleurotus ostreatus]